jgi:pimeloyl-ACP methyl ester carboxylesterase
VNLRAFWRTRGDRLSLSVSALACVALAVVGVLAGRVSDAYARGAVVSTTRVAHLSKADAASYLEAGGIGSQVNYGVDAYRVIYRSINTTGRSTPASGLVVMPDGGSGRLRTVLYEHGLLTSRRLAPSVNDTTTQPDRAWAIMFGAAGYAAVVPDYLGLGKGTGRHPYAHVPSEVNASVDLLRAVRKVADRQHRVLDQRALVTGFSQGAPAAMALGAKLQAGKVAHFQLGAVAGVSGPYDVQHVEAPAWLDGRVSPREAVLSTAYWVTSMNRIYHVYRRPADAFQAPYAAEVKRLFNGHEDKDTIVRSLPSKPEELLTPSFADRLRHPTGGLLRAMRASDSGCAWQPRVPVRIYAAGGDRTVPIQNARDCQTALRGTDVQLVDLGAKIDHAGSARLALPQILAWLEQIAPTG